MSILNYNLHWMINSLCCFDCIINGYLWKCRNLRYLIDTYKILYHFKCQCTIQHTLSDRVYLRGGYSRQNHDKNVQTTRSLESVHKSLCRQICYVSEICPNHQFYSQSKSKLGSLSLLGNAVCSCYLPVYKHQIA